MKRDNLRFLDPFDVTSQVRGSRSKLLFSSAGFSEIGGDRKTRRTGRPHHSLTRPFPEFLSFQQIFTVHKTRSAPFCCCLRAFAIVVVHNRLSTLFVLRRIFGMTALYTLQGSHLLVCMCGLPARGKTYIAQKGNSWETVTVADRWIVSRYLKWLSIPTKTFNVGQYRRNGGNAHPPASFFDPNNQEGSRQRELAAQEAFNDLLKWYTEGGVVAILDATNSTRKRREWIQMKCDDAGIRLMFVESVCDSEELVLSNILDVKVSSPDYIGQDPEKVRLNCCLNVC